MRLSAAQGNFSQESWRISKNVNEVFANFWFFRLYTRHFIQDYNPASGNAPWHNDNLPYDIKSGPMADALQNRHYTFFRQPVLSPWRNFITGFYLRSSKRQNPLSAPKSGQRVFDRHRQTGFVYKIWTDSGSKAREQDSPT